ncbi:MAG: ferredoxin [SAR324 cluster bacterium]|nr:ferredoxin [SAR324 cluster bacterium]
MSQKTSVVPVDIEISPKTGSYLAGSLPKFKNSSEVSSFEKPRTLPLIPPAAAASVEDMQKFWQEAFHFFKTEENGGIVDSDQEPIAYPALMAPYRDMKTVRHDYPLWITSQEENLPDSLFAELSELIAKAASSVDEGKILKDNLPRLENIVRQQVSSKIAIPSFRDVMEKAVEELRKGLSLVDNDEKILGDSTAKLLDQMPQEGSLVAFSEETPFYLLAHVLRVHALKKQKHFKKKVYDLRTRLHNLLANEKAKKKEERSPERVQSSLGLSSSFINSDAFSKIIPERSSVPMSEERIQRIQKTITTLQTFETIFTEHNSILLVPENWSSEHSFPWNTLFPSSSIISFQKGKGCSVTRQAFEAQTEKIVGLFSAVRVATLELENAYQSEIHDSVFRYFDWQSVTKEEIALCPPVFMINDALDLLESEYSDLSNLLLSANPINVLVVKRHSVSTQKSSLELGHLAISHRQACVAQSSPGNPKHLLQAFVDGIESTRPSLFYVLSPIADEHPVTNPYLWSGAALESRYFPVFNYNIQGGTQWDSCFDISHNPDPESDWPVHELKILQTPQQESSLSLAFTFADFAAQNPRFYQRFFLIPPCYWRDEMIPLSDYLKLSADESYAKIPFIWMIDKENLLQKVMVSQSIVKTCQERLDHWHVLQDLGGINNYHIKRAVEKTLAETKEEAAAKIEKIREVYEQELARTKKETARESMKKLSAILLDIDAIPIIQDSTGSAATIIHEEKPSSAPVELSAPAAEDSEEEPLSFDEPWIDSILCTTCNECTTLNPIMFQYNENKQAYIADASAGTFEQLAAAAEKCPVKCIHPGKPSIN